MTAGLVISSRPRPDQPFSAKRLEKVFNQCFTRRWRTRLVGGASEPLYQPAAEGADEHLLFYRCDYFASALHEVAHWCIAGARRREQVDFGYWYAPEGRSAAQQQAFEAVEYKPQALEWWFARACGYRFRVSLDNLDAQAGTIPDSGPLARRILAQALFWQRSGLPGRAGIFVTALSKEFGTRLEPGRLRFSLSELS